MEKTRVCTQCGHEKPLLSFPSHYREGKKRTSRRKICAECKYAWVREKRAIDPKWSAKLSASVRRSTLKRKYNLTEEEYEELLAKQGGVCAICEKKCATGKRLAVDHDHVTGKVRGLLCFKCNRAIGLFRDDPALFARAVQYLSAS